MHAHTLKSALFWRLWWGTGLWFCIFFLRAAWVVVCVCIWDSGLGTWGGLCNLSRASGCLHSEPFFSLFIQNLVLPWFPQNVANSGSIKVRLACILSSVLPNTHLVAGVWEESRRWLREPWPASPETWVAKNRSLYDHEEDTCSLLGSVALFVRSHSRCCPLRALSCSNMVSHLLFLSSSRARVQPNSQCLFAGQSPLLPAFCNSHMVGNH